LVERHEAGEPQLKPCCTSGNNLPSGPERYASISPIPPISLSINPTSAAGQALPFRALGFGSRPQLGLDPAAGWPIPQSD
jgi:hypothetical protein